MQLVRKLPTGSQQLLLQALGERPFLWGEESLPVLQLLVSQVRPVGVLGVTEQYEIKEFDMRVYARTSRFSAENWCKDLDERFLPSSAPSGGTSWR